MSTPQNGFLVLTDIEHFDEVECFVGDLGVV